MAYRNIHLTLAMDGYTEILHMEELFRDVGLIVIKSAGGGREKGLNSTKLVCQNPHIVTVGRG